MSNTENCSAYRWRNTVIVSVTAHIEICSVLAGQKRDARGIKTLRGLLHNIRMSFCSRTSSSQSPHDRRVKLFETSHQAIGYEWGCLSYLSGVKISDLVPFTMSQTLVDYQRSSRYLLGCFSLNKIPEISITRTILMIWLEPLEHIDKGVFIFRIFQFLVFKLVLFRGRHQLLPLPHG